MVLLDMTGFCSPSRIRASTARSRFPFRPFSTVELRFSSGKPMSRSVVNLESMPSPDVCTLEPNTREGLFTRGGDKSCRNSSRPGEMGGVMLRGEVAALRSPNPKRPLGFGGNGGGRSSELVLPVFCRVPGRESLRYILCSYFALMYRSIALSTSSISMGICGLTLRGLYVLLDSTLPMRFMLSTWALSHLSMLSDLTLEMCVPSLRCKAAHRMHRKMPRLQLAHPGLRAPQSAQFPFPGTDLMSSCNVRSLRACWRLFRADAMSCRERKQLGVGGRVGRSVEGAREQCAGRKGARGTAGLGDRGNDTWW